MADPKGAFPTKMAAPAATSCEDEHPSPMDLLPARTAVMYKSVTAPPRMGGVQRSCQPHKFTMSADALLDSFHNGASNLPPLFKPPARLATSPPSQPMDADVDPLAGFECPPCLAEAPQGPQPLPAHVVPHQCIALRGTSPAELLADVQRLVLTSALEVALDAARDGVFAVTGRVVVHHASARFAADVFAHEGGGAVEFRRTSGDPMAWHAFFLAMALALRRAHPAAAMLGGWNNGFPAEEALEEELAQRDPLECRPLSAEAVDELVAELAARSEFAAAAVAELATQCDGTAVGEEIAAKNVTSLLQHAAAVDVLITHVLSLKRDAAAQRGALFVLHECCRGSVAEQHRCLAQPRAILAKLAGLVEQQPCELVAQHVVRLVAVLAPAVGAHPPTAVGWQATMARACRVAAKYARSGAACLSTEALDDVRQLIGADVC